MVLEKCKCRSKFDDRALSIYQRTPVSSPLRCIIFAIMKPVGSYRKSRVQYHPNTWFIIVDNYVASLKTYQKNEGAHVNIFAILTGKKELLLVYGSDRMTSDLLLPTLIHNMPYCVPTDECHAGSTMRVVGSG